MAPRPHRMTSAYNWPLDRRSIPPALLHSILFNNHFLFLSPRLKSMLRADPVTDDSEIGPALCVLFLSSNVDVGLIFR